MATTTAINALRIPQSTDTPDVVRDVTNLANDIDKLLGAFVCTSTTNPSTPTPGQRFIWETDTLLLKVWNGTAYVQVNVDPPRAKLQMSAGASVASGAWGLAAWDTEVWKSVTSMHNTSTNNSRLIAPVAGTYAVNLAIVFAQNGTGVREVNLRTNSGGVQTGGTANLFAVNNGVSASAATSVNFTTEVALNANDYLEVFCLQNSGSALVIGNPPSNANTEFSMRRVSS